MTIKVHNSLTRQKEDFVPLDAKNIRIYACGPTVYNYAHIGNARMAVVFGLLADFMKHTYGQDHVTYISNITDIDDKIMAAAQQTGQPIAQITRKYETIYNEDMAALGVSQPDAQPRATDYVDNMIDMVTALIDKGHAYAAEGHVLFHVPSYEDYGALSGRNRDDMIAGARVEVAPYKKDPADFVLWKPSTEDQPGWDSPWGRGRPGWHLECSAMNAALNGPTFDIHAGGGDLVFPHHENEIAQSTCAHDGAPYARYWMHNGMLVIDGKKMSKSLGNIHLVHDLLKDYPGEVLRFALLSGHYRQPLDFSQSTLEQARSTLDRYYSILRDNQNVTAISAPIPDAVISALQDDLNTPLALSALATSAKRLATTHDADKEQAKGELLATGHLLGFLQESPDVWFQAGADQNQTQDIETQIARLQDARNQKDYATADAIRDTLKTDYNVTISVTKDGIQWRVDT